MKTCETCRFWSQWDKDDRQGFCHRFPPGAFSRKSGGEAMWRNWQFPIIRGTDWCGEHIPREAEDE